MWIICSVDKLNMTIHVVLPELRARNLEASVGLIVRSKQKLQSHAYRKVLDAGSGSVQLTVH